ncbi:MAG: AraC family transcriptional regulator [Gemmatimonadales bacterium]
MATTAGMKPDGARAQAGSRELAERICGQMREDGAEEAAPGLFLYRASAPTGPRFGVSEPSFCVIAQGAKEVMLGGERYRYDASRYLLASIGLPVVSHIVAASRETPYLAVRVVLDPATLSAALLDSGLIASRTEEDMKGLAVSTLDPDLLDALVRLIRLLDTPDDLGALAPLIKREIVYRLLLGEQGGRLRQFAAAGGRGHRIARAIERLRAHRGKPLGVEGLAKQAGMSVSGFHHQFKAVTAMSPLQFQKQLRLQEARRLLLAGDVDAATAGYRVGYDDPAHFSREYKRLFGNPPMRDVERARGAAGVRTELVVSGGAL